MRTWAHGSRSITFTTSGTSGAPLQCTHRWASNAQELDAQAALFADRQRIVGLVGPRHIYAVPLMGANEGLRLKAFVVVQAGVTGATLRPALRLWMQARLSTAEMPANIVFEDALPRNAYGKLANWTTQRDRA